MSITLNTTMLNNLITNNKKAFNLNTYYNINIIEPNLTITLGDTIIKYSKDIKVLFCSNCLINLTSTNYIKHLQKKHLGIYNNYEEEKLINTLKSKIASLEFNNIEEIVEELEFNKYYFKELPITFNNYKCLERNFTNINRKNIRIHYNKEHSLEEDTTNTTNTTTKATYIIEDVPLQYLEGYKDSKKIYFIPKIPRINIIEEEPTTTRSSSRYYSSSSINSSSNSNTREDKEELNTRALETNTKSLIINNYIKEEYNRSNDSRENNPLEQNRKLLNSFITKSNIYKYLEDKNRDILISLLYNSEYNSTLDSNNTRESRRRIIEIDTSLDYNKIEEIIVNLLIEIDSRINNINLLLRQLLKNDNNNKNIKDFKDFIPLENKYTKETYYSVFSRLVVFILKVFYILSKFKDTTNSLELEYLNTINTLRLERSTKQILNSIEKTDFNLLDIEESRVDFNSKLINLFTELLKDINYLSFKEDTTLKNIVIAYFYISCLDKNTKEIKPIDYISKITSIIIYNSRLITLGYFYNKEIKEEIDLKDISKEIKGFITTYLSNNSNNYFEFLSTIRPYILSLNKEAISTNYTIGEVTNNIIEYNSIEDSIENFRILFRNIYNKLNRILLDKLLKVENINSLNINFSRINDTSLLNNVNNSILDLEELKYYKYSKPYFLEQLLTNNTYYNRTLFKRIRNNKIKFRASNIERFNRNINTFIELLAIAINLFSGGSLRSIELVSIFYKNIETRDRSLFFNKEDSIFTISTNYYKSINITRKEKTNIRFLPPYLSKLIVIYIVFIIPFNNIVNNLSIRL